MCACGHRLDMSSVSVVLLLALHATAVASSDLNRHLLNTTTRLQKGKYFALLSNPAQASTLVSNILTALPQLNTPDCVIQSCGGAQEALNPRCRSKCHGADPPYVDGIFVKDCMGSQGNPYRNNIWKPTCPDRAWKSIIEGVVTHNITYFKDNFSPMKVERLVSSGFEVIVSMKAPWHTFPSPFSGMYEGSHDALCAYTMDMRNQQYKQFNMELLRDIGRVAWKVSCTRDLVNKTSMTDGRVHLDRQAVLDLSKESPCLPCRSIIAHYLQYFALYTQAQKHKLHLIDPTKLLLLPENKISNYLELNLPSSLLALRNTNETNSSADWALNRLVNETLLVREGTRVHGHSSSSDIEFGKKDSNGNVISIAEQITRKREHDFITKIDCIKCLRRVSSECESRISGCDSFNRYIKLKKFLDSRKKYISKYSDGLFNLSKWLN